MKSTIEFVVVLAAVAVVRNASVVVVPPIIDAKVMMYWGLKKQLTTKTNQSINASRAVRLFNISSCNVPVVPVAAKPPACAVFTSDESRRDTVNGGVKTTYGVKISVTTTA